VRTRLATADVKKMMKNQLDRASGLRLRLLVAPRNSGTAPNVYPSPAVSPTITLALLISAIQECLAERAAPPSLVFM
jgi:hypothetical protein